MRKVWLSNLNTLNTTSYNFHENCELKSSINPTTSAVLLSGCDYAEFAGRGHIKKKR